MIPLATLRELFDYNYWARDRQLQACAALTEEPFLRPLGSSFSSLRDTLVHLVGVEWLYLERWRGHPPQALPAAEEFPNLTAITQRWTDIEREMRGHLGGLTDDTLARPFTYTNLRGQTVTLPLWQIHYHFLNHQTYHRGQVSTLLRQLGSTPVATDFYVYLLSRR